MDYCVARSKSGMIRTMMYMNDTKCGTDSTDVFMPYLRFVAFSAALPKTRAFCVNLLN